MEDVVGGAGYVGNGVWVEVVARPVTGVPAMQVCREGAGEGLKYLPHLGIFEADADVVVSLEGKDRSVEDKGRRACRVLLDKRCSVEAGQGAALGNRHSHW